MLTNASCTLYRYNKETEGYDHYFIPSVFWHENKGGNTLKSGLQSVHSTTVYLYDESILPETPTKDLLVKGECSFQFDNATPKSVSESFAQFKKENKFVTVMSIDNCFFGSLPHCEVTGK